MSKAVKKQGLMGFNGFFYFVQNIFPGIVVYWKRLFLFYRDLYLVPIAYNNFSKFLQEIWFSVSVGAVIIK